MPYYVGILDSAKAVWGIRMPDVPGATVAILAGGSDCRRDQRPARDRVRRAAKGIALKSPRRVQAVIADKASGFDAGAGESIVMVPLILDRGRPVKANISLDAGLLEAIDDEAVRRGLSAVGVSSQRSPRHD